MRERWSDDVEAMVEDAEAFYEAIRHTPMLRQEVDTLRDLCEGWLGLIQFTERWSKTRGAALSKERDEDMKIALAVGQPRRSRGGFTPCPSEISLAPRTRFQWALAVVGSDSSSNPRLAFVVPVRHIQGDAGSLFKCDSRRGGYGD
jgi:hypothetical protein